MKLKDLFKNLLLLFIVCLMIFILLEIGVRVFAPESKRQFQFNDIVGPMRIPNIEFKHRSETFGLITHHTNSQGFVDLEHKIDKDEDVYRVVFLGDSFTAAIHVPLNKTFCRVLENKLQESGIDKKFEVINLGVGGYATDNEYLILKEFGLKYNPDLVILMTYARNDIFYNSLALSNEPSKPYFELENNALKQVQWPKPIIHNKLTSFLIKYTRAPRFFYSKFRLLIARMGELKEQAIGKENPTWREHLNVYSKEYSPDWEKAWQMTRALIKEIKLISQDKGANFLLVYIPDLTEIDSELWNSALEEYPSVKDLEWDLDKPSNTLEKLSQQEDINYLNLLPFFREYVAETGEELYEDHFSIQGHELAAELMYEFLINNNLIKL